jgi:dienelactone hydrolase
MPTQNADHAADGRLDETTTVNGSRTTIEPEEVSFVSGGLRCDGWLFRPNDPAPHSCLVMAHGFGGIRAARLDAFAERFAAAGVAAFAFDYRHLGTSEGQPRGLIDIDRQRDDYRAAIRCMRSLPDIDADRIAVWGTSFSSGHVLTVAAEDARIAGAVMTNPYVDGLAAVHKSRKTVGVRVSLALAARWLGDEIQRLRSAPPVRVELTGPPGSTALFTTPGAAEGYASILPADRSGWEPAVPARVLLRLLSDRPVRLAHEVRRPLLICVCERDRIAPVSPAVKVAEDAPRGELRRYPYQHFDVFTGAGFERTVTDQTVFLRRTLL